MLVTYKKLEDKYPDSVNKYGYEFKDGESVEVAEPETIEKFKSHPLFNVAKEVKEVKSRKKRVSNDENGTD